MIYIRPDYVNIEKQIMSAPQVQYLILGTPGIGTSCFLIYLLCRLLQQNKSVILRRGVDLQCFLFTQGQVCVDELFIFQHNMPQVFESLAIGFAKYLENPDVWYLVDTVRDPERVEAKTVFTCSPRREYYRQYRKYPGRITLYMPLWNKEELTTLCNVVYPTFKDVLEDRFLKFGGIPRSIFSNDDPDIAITSAVRRYLFFRLHEFCSCRNSM